MAAPQLIAGERRPQHQLGTATEIRHQFGKLQIQLANAAHQGQLFQASDHFRARHASTLFDSSKR
ncbi:hypothetical protein D3C78_1806310 [compost metagenome]